MVYDGDRIGFSASRIRGGLLQKIVEVEEENDERHGSLVEEKLKSAAIDESGSEADTATAPSETATDASFPKKQRKVVEEEVRAVGSIRREIWRAYLRANGGIIFWTAFTIAVSITALTPIVENGWLRYVFLSSFRITQLFLIWLSESGLGIWK